MLKRVAHCIVLVLLFTASVRVCAESSPAFWRVSDNNSQVHLLGSMHFGAADFYPLPKSVEEAYKASDALAVEIDITNLNPMELAATVQKYAGLSSGQSLATVLGESLTRELTQFSEQQGLSMAMWQMWQPWFIAMQLVQLELQKSSLQANKGVDFYFLNKKDRPVIELETMDDQLGLFAAFSDEEQRFFLQQTLTDLRQAEVYLSKMSDAWRLGNMQSLEALLLEPFASGDAGKAFFKKLFTDRNRVMADNAARFLTEDKEIFIVVGAGHMLGDTGIVALLKKRGYKVERIIFEAPKS